MKMIEVEYGLYDPVWYSYYKEYPATITGIHYFIKNKKLVIEYDISYTQYGSYNFNEKNVSPKKLRPRVDDNPPQEVKE